MRKFSVCIIFLVVIFLFSGCSDVAQNGEKQPNAVQNEAKPPRSFLADEENYYSLLIVRDKNMKHSGWHGWIEKNNIRNVNHIRGMNISLKQFNEQYKFLELEELPAFVAFDTKGIAFKTNDEKKLIQYLHEKVPEGWNH